MDTEEKHEEDRTAIYVEDGLILLSIGVLFALGVFYRQETWAQIVLGGVLLLMLVIFVRRYRRAKRAFQSDEQDHPPGG